MTVLGSRAGERSPRWGAAGVVLRAMPCSWRGSRPLGGCSGCSACGAGFQREVSPPRAGAAGSDARGQRSTGARTGIGWPCGARPTTTIRIGSPDSAGKTHWGRKPPTGTGNHLRKPTHTARCTSCEKPSPIGAGNHPLGQANYLPQCAVTYPNATAHPPQQYLAVEKLPPIAYPDEPLPIPLRECARRGSCGDSATGIQRYPVRGAVECATGSGGLPCAGRPGRARGCGVRDGGRARCG